MVWIGVQNLPYCESRQTSYAGVSLQKLGHIYRNAGKLWNSPLGRVGTCRLKNQDNGQRSTQRFQLYSYLWNRESLESGVSLRCSSRVMGNYHARFLGGEKISLAYSSDIFPTLRATCKGLHLIDLLSSLNFDKSCCSVNSTLWERAYKVWRVYSETRLVRSLSIMFLISVRDTNERVWNSWEK